MFDSYVIYITDIYISGMIFVISGIVKLLYNMINYYIMGGDGLQLKVAICEDDKIISEDTQRRILEIRPDYAIDTYSMGKDA